jgi:hypothetical protein
MKTTDSSSPDACLHCRHLRTKRMYIPELAHGALGEPGHDEQVFYTCNRTLGALGCDDDAVHPGACRDGRGCFEA